MPNYFTAKTFEFLQELKENNNKEWFDAHKGVYEEHLYKPIKDLVSLLSPAMHGIDAEFELRPHRAVSRIYRDIRFSKDKTPYKTHMWLTFQKAVPREEWTNVPGYYISIGVEGYYIGMGLFMPKKKTMDALKEEIGYVRDEFREHVEQDVFARGFSIEGERYKKKVASDLGEFFEPWVQGKSVWVEKARPIGEELFSPEFYKSVEADFVALEWLYKFMKEVSEL